ncbi:MAG: HEPN domain-containing protein [archaeon]
MRKDVEVWVQQAEIDLETAEKNFHYEIYYASAFFCQQALEKMMKALFMLQRKERVPTTHNLRELGESISLPENLLSKARKISRDFIVSRYPDAAGDIPAKAYDKEITADILEDTRKVFEWLEKEIEKFQTLK